MKHTTAFLIYATLTFSLSLFSACECEELSPVTPDGMPNTFLATLASGSIDTDIFMSVTFNRDVDGKTFIAGQSVFVEGLSSVDVFVSANRIVLSGPGTNCSNGNCRVNITLKGTGPDTVKSAAGEVLDGDADGTKGGDYVVELVVD